MTTFEQSRLYFLCVGLLGTLPLSACSPESSGSSDPTHDTTATTDATHATGATDATASESDVGPDVDTGLPAGPAIHVALEGSDTSGDGSESAPFRHIQYALENAAVDGSVVLAHPGTYHEQVRIRQNHVTLASASGERAHITCPLSTDESDPPLCIEIDAETTGVTLRGLEVSGGFYAVYLGSQWDYDDTPRDNLAANHVRIEDCVIHDTGRDAVKVPAGCDDITIARCEVYNSGQGYPPGTALDDKNAEGIDIVNADRVHIADTYIHDTATTCLYIKGGSIGAVVERTRVERCGGLGIALGFDTSPEFFDTAANPDYFENLDGTVRNCIVIDTGLAGLALYATRNAQLIYNTVVRAGTLGHAAIYLGVATQDYDPMAGRPANLNPTIVGNVVDQTGLATPVCFGIRYTVEDELGILSGLSGAATVRDNLYFAGTGRSCTFNDGRPTTLVEDGELGAWQSHVAGFDLHSRMADPHLDATGHLQAGSAAIDVISAGDALTPSDDVDGQARLPPLDLGADEF